MAASTSTIFSDILLHHYPEILTAIVSFLLISHFRSYRAQTSSLIRNWPVLGMLPGLIANFHSLHDMVTSVLRDSGFTFTFKGPWLLNMGFLVTCDPSNINHIFNTNFTNYVKGKELAESFDVFGEGLFGTNRDSWPRQRRLAQSIFVEADFRSMPVRAIRNKVEHGVVPFLDNMASERRIFDLQDVFIRLTFDVACDTVLGLDLGSLSVPFPEVSPFSEAFDDVEDALMLRQLMPASIWKIMRWLNVGSEKKLTSAWRLLDCFILEQIGKIREKRSTSSNTAASDMMTLYMNRSIEDDKFLRDTAFTFLLAVRDAVSITLSWFFYLLSTNPNVESKILNELTSTNYNDQRKGTALVFDANMVHSAVYLHAALRETLRLYPPLPFEHREVLKTDVLPSGEAVQGGSRIVIPICSMGTLESIWGEDCCEYKPERWITESGRLRYEPSHKFFAFLSGPRTCLGREIAFIQMKIVAATLIYNYHVGLVEGYVVTPKNSAILRMQNGMMARVTKRSPI